MWRTAVSGRSDPGGEAGISSTGLTAAGLAVGLIVTGLILWSPYLVFGYHSPAVHLMLDSVDACVALLVAYLVHGRYVRDSRLQDLLLAQGLVLLAVAGLGLRYAVEAIPGFEPGTLDIWLPLAIRVIGAVCIASAALAPTRRLEATPLRLWSWAVPAAMVAVVSISLWAIRARLPVAFDVTALPPSAEEPPLLTGHPMLLLAQGTAALCFLIASLAFTSQAMRRPADQLLRWLGPACALAAFARVNYSLFPSLYTDWLYTGDLLRTGCYFLLLVGATREMRQYWSAQARAAVLEDRRRLARELHDGVIQELAYIRSESYAIPADNASGDRIIAACDRALDETRAAVQALGRAGDDPLGFMLHRAARELAQRYEVQLEVDLDDSINAAPDQRHALMRITREAVSNAVRHGKAKRVSVRLSRAGDQRRLAIHDDGSGFDVASAVAGNAGYGLISMRERARTLPGSFDVEATGDTGSIVTVTW